MSVTQEHWHLDKRVPISLIATLIIQTIAIVWWASAIESRVVTLEEATLNQKQDIVSTTNQLNSLNITMSRVDTTLLFLSEDVQALLVETRKD